MRGNEIIITRDDIEELDRLLTEHEYHVSEAPDLNLQRQTLISGIDSIRRRLELIGIFPHELLARDLQVLRRQIEDIGVF